MIKIYNGFVSCELRKTIVCSACLVELDEFNIIFSSPLSEGSDENLRSLDVIRCISLLPKSADLDFIARKILRIGNVDTEISIVTLSDLIGESVVVDGQFRFYSDAEISGVNCQIGSRNKGNVLEIRFNKVGFVEIDIM